MDRAIVEGIGRVVENILNQVRLENDLIEELLLDWDDDDDGAIDNNLNYLDLAQRAIVHAVDQIVQVVLLWEDEDEFSWEDEREVLDGEFKRLVLRRFYELEDAQFKQHFRMNKQTFEILINEFALYLTAEDVNLLERLRTGLDVCLLMALWILGNLCSFRKAATVFGVSKSVVHFHYKVVIQALRAMSSKFIKWPTALQRRRMKETIEAATDFPGVIGMMDGMLVTVTAPAIQKERYFDRHHQYSYNVMFVCNNNNRKLIFAYVGEPGSVRDSRIFQRSPLHNILLERREFLGDDEHLLADGAYTLTSLVLVPYRNNGRLTPRQIAFNFVHSGRRMRIEHTNGLVKNKWRRLFRLHVRNANYAVDYLMACAVLHNFVLLEGREPDGMALHEDDAVRHNPPDGPAAVEHPLLNAARRAGVQKRDAIAQLLHPQE